MSQFAHSWKLSRYRFQQALKGLDQSQLNWRLHPGTLTIGEMALHVAGVEAFFMRQLLGCPLTELQESVARTATDGVVNDLPFPFAQSEITPEFVESTLDWSESLVSPFITAPSPELLAKELVSALGPVITGEGALARLGFHAGYHQGQVQMISTAPGFPRP